MSGFTRNRGDLHDSTGDLGHFEGEELSHQGRMCAAHRNLRTLESLANGCHIYPNSLSVRVFLGRYLLLGRQYRLNGAQVDMDHPWVGALLHDTGNDVSFTTLEFAQDVVIRNVPEPLIDDLFSCKCGDAAEVARHILCFADDGTLVVEFGDKNRNLSGLAIKLHAGTRRMFARLVVWLTSVLHVGSQYRLLNNQNQFLERNFPFAFHEAQHAQVDVH